MVMSADLEEVVMSVLFVCCNVCWRWVYCLCVAGFGGDECIVCVL